jgi:hypothetical protein
MAVTAPEWLAKRGGEVRRYTAGPGWVVVFRGEPQYRLHAVPAEGKFGCQVVQTINSKRFDVDKAYATEDEAVNAGLDQVRKVLGW